RRAGQLPRDGAGRPTRVLTAVAGSARSCVVRHSHRGEKCRSRPHAMKMALETAGFAAATGCNYFNRKLASVRLTWPGKESTVFDLKGRVAVVTGGNGGI